jgi:phosphoglycolate phosphatase
MKSKYDYLFFDLDGTLTDSGEGIMRSVSHALSFFGIEEQNVDKLRRFVGPPLEASFETFYGLTKEQAEKAVDIYHDRYRPIGVFENRPYDGIEECLQELKDSGYHLVVATSKPIDMAMKVLKHFNLLRYFEFVAARDMEGLLYSKADVIRYALKEHSVTDVSRVLMIGDRKFDVLGAREVGFDCVGVLYGYGDLDEMKRANAKYVVGTVGELKQLLLQ